MTEDTPTPEQQKRTTREQVRLVAAILITALVVAFAFTNSQRVEVDYLVTTRDSRLIYVIVGSAVLGAIADRLLQWRRRRHEQEPKG